MSTFQGLERIEGREWDWNVPQKYKEFQQKSGNGDLDENDQQVTKDRGRI